MVRTYRQQNKYVKGARPEVTEAIVERIALGMYRMEPASELAQEIGVSRVTIAKYYDALFDRLFSNVCYAMCQAPLAKLDEQISASKSMLDDPAVAAAIRWYAESFPYITQEALHRVLKEVHTRIYRDKKTKKIVQDQDKIEQIATKDFEDWPEWLKNNLLNAAWKGASFKGAITPEHADVSLSVSGLMMRGTLNVLTDTYVMGIAQTITRVFFQAKDYFVDCSKRHKSLSLPLFERAYIMAFLAGTPSPDTSPWRSPNTLLMDLIEEPLDFSKSS